MGEIRRARRPVGALRHPKHIPRRRAPLPFGAPRGPAYGLHPAPPSRRTSPRGQAGPWKCLLAALSPDAGRPYRLSRDSRDDGSATGISRGPCRFHRGSDPVEAAAEVRSLRWRPATTESVDCWPMANDTPRHSGAGLGRYPHFLGVIGVRYPPLAARKSQFETPGGNCSSLRRTAFVRNSVGAIGWSKGSIRFPRDVLESGDRAFAPLSSSYSGLRADRRTPASAGAPLGSR